LPTRIGFWVQRFKVQVDLHEDIAKLLETAWRDMSRRALEQDVETLERFEASGLMPQP
jgi:hypothetical protein